MIIGPPAWHMQTVKNPPAVQETWVQSLGQEDHLEKEMETHSQYSCLENPMDRGALWAPVHGIARVRHDLVTKQLDHCTKKRLAESWGILTAAQATYLGLPPT